MQIDKKKRLKILIIGTDGNQTPYYLNDLLKKSRAIDIPHKDILPLFFGHLNKQVTKKMKKMKKMAYHDQLKTLTELGYTVFLDTTNYQNYSEDKKHDGLLLFPEVLSTQQQKKLLAHYAAFSDYEYITTGYFSENCLYKDLKSYTDFVNLLCENKPKKSL